MVLPFVSYSDILRFFPINTCRPLALHDLTIYIIFRFRMDRRQTFTAHIRWVFDTGLPDLLCYTSGLCRIRGLYTNYLAPSPSHWFLMGLGKSGCLRTTEETVTGGPPPFSRRRLCNPPVSHRKAGGGRESCPQGMWGREDKYSPKYR